ncbi:hypothetical protein QTP88_011132 [Uroleucon formosanum]
MKIRDSDDKRVGKTWELKIKTSHSLKGRTSKSLSTESLRPFYRHDKPHYTAQLWSGK